MMAIAESPTPMQVHDILHDQFTYSVNQIYNELNLYTNLLSWHILTPLKSKCMVKNDHWKAVCMGHGGVYDGV